MMPEKLKERNHFIPKTYLEKFLNKEGRLYVYKKGVDFFKDGIKKESRLFIAEGRDGLNEVAVKNKLYIPEGNFSEDKNIFEDFFAKEIEAKYNDFLKFVEANFLNAPKIFENYRDYIILLIASMISRTLHSKAEIEEIYKVNFQTHHWAQSFDEKRDEKLIRFIKEKQPKLTDAKAKEIVKEYLEMVEKGKFSLKLPRNLFIKHIFKNMELYAKLISNMTIQILRCDEPSYFITTDVPVVYFVPNKKVKFPYSHKSLGGLHTELYFPLSQNLCLLLTRRKIDVLTCLPVDNETVYWVNYNMSYNSGNFIFSPERDPLLEKFIEKYIPYPFKLVMRR